MNLNLKYKNQGFTLMELMLVVAIVGILSAVAIPAYNGYMENGRIAECSNEVTAIKLAQKQYFLENNRYFPGTGTDTSSATTSGGNDYTDIEGVSGGYFRSTLREHGAIGGAAYNLHDNCDYTITSISSGSGYEIAVSGINSLSSADLSSFTLTIN